MLLTITTTYQPATDLGYLLHKHPGHVQSFQLSFGQAHVFYPQASPERCTAALLLDVDTVGLVRGRRGRGGGGFSLAQYVNDRPYVASSFLSVAIAQVYGTALAGRSKDRPALAEQALPLSAQIAVLPSRGGDELLRRLFEPLGYAVTTQRHALDPAFPDWGDSPYFTVSLEATVRLADLLSHLYVLIPVMDADKHYYVDEQEVEKLLRRGEGWLARHPERKIIADRYLKRKRSLTRIALARLVEEDAPDPDDSEEQHDQEEAVVEEQLSLNEQRLGAVLAALKASGAKRVLDLGCGEGRLLKLLLGVREFEEIVGLDVSHWSLEKAARRLRLERLPPMQRDRIQLMQGALTYRDDRIAGYDAAAVVEVIEHFDPPRLAAFERAVFEFAQPRTVIITTPNVEYNVLFETLPAGKFRHRDHRFEWARAEFRSWAEVIGERHGYTARFLPVGPEDTNFGSPTQMGIFTLNGMSR